MVAGVAVLHQILVMITGDMVYFVSSRESVCIAWVPTNLTCDRVTRVISVIFGSCRQTACALPAMPFFFFFLGLEEKIARTIAPKCTCQ